MKTLDKDGIGEKSITSEFRADMISPQQNNRIRLLYFFSLF
uniref:Uncharacterized protein n=1 Tax=Nelumbo nucifera TaxID=4432 RepID=A0A822YBC0_NELNU|nr:TPA_asm: hypothetical protein HUJ06_031328 [Nelumbo nucifera]